MKKRQKIEQLSKNYVWINIIILVVISPVQGEIAATETDKILQAKLYQINRVFF